jgi:type I restriction enzyme S subunit
VTRSVAPIKKFAIGIYDGPHATPKPSDQGPIFLGIKNVTEEGRLDFSEIRHVSEADFPKWTRRVKPQKDDIVFSYEATLHRYARLPDDFEGCLGRRMALVRPDPTRVDPRFLLYYFLSPIWRAKMDAITITGATVNRIPLTIFPDTEVSFPGLNEQTAIAETLTPYDDLIENNRQRIALLEEAARMLYREWFVLFHFPGHEHVKIIDCIPEGWERRTLAALAEDVSYGFTASADFETDGPKFLRITDIVDGPIEWDRVPRCSIPETKLEGFLLDAGDIVVARTGATTGWARRIGRLSERVVFASYLVRFRFGETYRPEIAATYMQSDSYKGFVKQNLGGAAQPNASAKVLGSAIVPVPPAKLQLDFATSVRPTLDQIDILMEQNQVLAKARDLLLPRLMKGEIAV